MRVRADCSGEFSDPDAFPRLLQPFQGAAKLVIHQRHFQAEGDRLGVDAVGAPDHRRELEFPRFFRDRNAEGAEILQQHAGGFVHLHRQGGVEHIGGGHPVVNPPGGRPDVAGDVFQECNDVVIGSFLDFLNIGQVKARLFANGDGVLLRDHAEFGLGLAGEHLDFKPDFVLVLLFPERSHLWKGITVDHPVRIRTARVVKRKNCGNSRGRCPRATRVRLPPAGSRPRYARHFTSA